MKRILIFLFALVLMVNLNPSFAENQMQDDVQNEVVQQIDEDENLDVKQNEEQNDNSIVINGHKYQIENDSNADVLIVKYGDNYGLYKKSESRFLFEPIAIYIMSLFSDNKKFVISTDKVIYINTESNITKEFAPTDFIWVTPELEKVNDGQFLVRKNGQAFYLYDVNAQLVLDFPFYDVITNANNQIEILITNVNGFSEYYDIYGNKMTEYDIVQKKENVSHFVKDIKPEILSIILENKKSQQNENTVIDAGIIEKTVVLDRETIKSYINEENVLKVGFKKLYKIEHEGLIGVADSKGKLIIPIKYTSLDIIKPCKCYLSPLISLRKNGLAQIFTNKGRLIAEENGITFHYYTNKHLYVIKRNNEGNNVVLKDGKTIGRIYYNEKKGKISFMPLGNSTFSPHKLINLYIIF